MTSTLIQCAKTGVFALALVTVLAAPAYAKKDRGVPEIDPGSASAAIAIAGGGLAVLRDRIKRRK